jgi:hypothetical protein
MEAIVDEKRTVPAGKSVDQTHIVVEKEHGFMTLCGYHIAFGDLCVLLVKPSDITCPKCAELGDAKIFVRSLCSEPA